MRAAIIEAKQNARCSELCGEIDRLKSRIGSIADGSDRTANHFSQPGSLAGTPRDGHRGYAWVDVPYGIVGRIAPSPEPARVCVLPPKSAISRIEHFGPWEKLIRPIDRDHPNRTRLKYVGDDPRRRAGTDDENRFAAPIGKDAG